MAIPQVRWMVYFMENTIRMDDDWRYPSLVIQGGAPPVISWFITPEQYRYIYHKPELLEL